MERSGQLTRPCGTVPGFSPHFMKFSRSASPARKIETIVVDEVLAELQARDEAAGNKDKDSGASKDAGAKPSPSVASGSKVSGVPTASTPVGINRPVRSSTPYPETRKVRGIWCENCNSRLVELKKQAVKLWMPFAMHRDSIQCKESELLQKVEEKLHIPERLRRHLTRNDVCEVCDTHVSQLKLETLGMVQSLERTQAEMGPAMVEGRRVVQLPRTTPHYTSAHHRSIRQGSHNGHSSSSTTSSTSNSNSSSSGLPPRHGSPHPQAIISAHHHHPDKHNHHVWLHSAKRAYNQMILNGGHQMVSTRSPGVGEVSLQGKMNQGHGIQGQTARPTMLPVSVNYHHDPHHQQHPSSRGHPNGHHFAINGVPSPASTSSTNSNPSAAASFFARAAQKLNISSRKKKKHHSASSEHPPDPEPPPFPTNFRDIIWRNPPAAPPCLMRAVGRPQHPGSGKVKVMLRVCPVEGNHSSFLSIDPYKKQVTVYDPAASGYITAAHRRAGVAAPKMFAFDSVFSQDDSLAEVCSTSLVEIVQAVVNGADGCLFCYGHARLGKTYTMIGIDDSSQNLGIIPCAIAWLFKLINEQKEKTGARFSVRVSAVEVTGKRETLKDLLADVAGGMEAGSSTAPGVYLREDPITGTQLENQSELRAPTADRAAYYLDAAVAARTIPEVEEDARNSHLLFTLHVYQYQVDKAGKGPSGVAGGRSRLHLIDLGSCSKSKEGNALSLSALGNVILQLLNGQRHVSHRDSKLTQLIRESLGNFSCRTCMIAHVSPTIQSYNETLQVVQLAARIHRMKRRKMSRISSGTSSDDSSCDGSGHLRRIRPGVRMGVLREDAGMYSSSGRSYSDPDYTSSEQSCDTVIYVGKNGQPLSDRDLTDNEGPPRMGLRHRISGSKSSGDESSGSEFRPRIPKCGASMMLNSRVSHHNGSVASNEANKDSVQHKAAAAMHSSSLPHRVRAKPPMYVKPKPHKTSEDHSAQDDRTVTSRSRAPHVDSSNKSEQWIDGPAAPPTVKEQWIDGPKPSDPPASSASVNKEQWIDGPNASVSSKSNSNSNTNSKPKKPPVNNNTELWVDGPQEFQMNHQGEPARTRPSRPSKMWTGMAKGGQHKSSSRDPTAPSKPKTTENKSLRNPVLNNVASCDSRPVSQVSTDSNTSMAVNPNSRPVSMHAENSDSTAEVQHNNNNNKAELCCEEAPKMTVNTFVRDWVEKHSVITDTPPEANKRHASRPEKLQRGSRSVQLCAESRASSQSPERKVTSAHSSPRVRRGHKKQALPQPTNPTDRTAAWVMSVQHTSPKVPSSERSRHHSHSATDGGNKYYQLPSRSNQEHEHLEDMDNYSPPPAYEVCIEQDRQHQQEQEQLLRRESLKDRANDEVIKTENLVITEMDGNKPGDKLRTTAADNNKDTDTTSESQENPLDTRSRDSIYELQMDETLETVKGDSSHRMTFASEDDAWSSSSCSKDLNTSRSKDNCQTDAQDTSLTHDEGVSNLDITIDTQNTDTLSPLTVNADAESGIASCPGDHLSPPSSEDSEKTFGKKIQRPTCLRRPDGASNPNLSFVDPIKPLDDIPEALTKESFLPLATSTSKSSAGQGGESILMRSVVGQSPEEKCSVSASDLSPAKTSKLPVMSPTKPPLANKPSILPKPNKKSPTKSPSKSTEKPIVPPRVSSRLSSSKSETSSPSRSIHSTSSSPAKSVSSFGKSSKDKSARLSKSASSSPVPSTQPRPFSAKSSSKSSKLPSFGRSKSQSSSPTKSSGSSSKESSKSSRTASKSPSPTKRDRERDSKLPTKSGKHKGRMTDSDSGNDSGIVRNDCQLLSPYSKVTKPRVSVHSTSSGHGSDNSSIFGNHKLNKLAIQSAKTEVSSGYESMMRDSEAATSSSTTDSNSECSGRIRTSKNKKKALSKGRSRSAPASTRDSPSGSRVQSPAPSSRKAFGPAPSKAWVDTRHAAQDQSEPMEIKMYDVDDVERMARRRREEAELMATELRRQRIKELFSKQDDLKSELMDAKNVLMIDGRTWSFDLHVAEHMDHDDTGYVEALEKETSILEKRVEACKSRIMMVTCFDINV